MSVIALIAIMLASVLGWVPATGAMAAPGAPPADARGESHTVDWLSAETAARLDLGFSIVVPPFVPAPFGGEPAVQTDGGSYSLYWMIPGADPTFLEITGTVGGAIPAYSWYDRNVQLEQNATVQGFAGWHDLTPIYDLVYWQNGDVVYSVNSQGMTGTDTISLANSLIVLDQPEPAAVDSPPVDPVEDNGTVDEPAPVDDQPDGVDAAVTDDQADTGTDEPSPAGVDAEAPASGTTSSSADDGSGQDPIATGARDPDSVGSTAADQSQASSETATDAGITFGIPKTIQAGQVATIGLHGVSDVMLETDGGTFVETGGSTYPNAGGFAVEWTAPLVAGNLLVTFSVVDPSTSHVVATGQTQVLGADDAGPVAASLSGPISTVSDSLVYLSVTGHGRVVVDSSVGSWPVTSPNTLFDPGATGDGMLVGNLTDGEPATVLWRAPVVETTTATYLYATDRSGATTATWVITVRPGDLPPVPTPTPGPVVPAPAPAPQTLPAPPDLPDPGFDFNGIGPKAVDGDGTVSDPPTAPIVDPSAPSPTPAAG